MNRQRDGEKCFFAVFGDGLSLQSRAQRHSSEFGSEDSPSGKDSSVQYDEVHKVIVCLCVCPALLFVRCVFGCSVLRFDDSISSWMDELAIYQPG